MSYSIEKETVVEFFTALAVAWESGRGNEDYIVLAQEAVEELQQLPEEDLVFDSAEELLQDEVAADLLQRFVENTLTDQELDTLDVGMSLIGEGKGEEEEEEEEEEGEEEVEEGEEEVEEGEEEGEGEGGEGEEEGEGEGGEGGEDEVEGEEGEVEEEGEGEQILAKDLIDFLETMLQSDTRANKKKAYETALDYLADKEIVNLDEFDNIFIKTLLERFVLDKLTEKETETYERGKPKLTITKKSAIDYLQKLLRELPASESNIRSRREKSLAYNRAIKAIEKAELFSSFADLRQVVGEEAVRNLLKEHFRGPTEKKEAIVISKAILLDFLEERLKKQTRKTAKDRYEKVISGLAKVREINSLAVLDSMVHDAAIAAEIRDFLEKKKPATQKRLDKSQVIELFERMARGYKALRKDTSAAPYVSAASLLKRTKLTFNNAREATALLYRKKPLLSEELVAFVERYEQNKLSDAERKVLAKADAEPEPEELDKTPTTKEKIIDFLLDLAAGYLAQDKKKEAEEYRKAAKRLRAAKQPVTSAQQGLDTMWRGSPLLSDKLAQQVERMASQTLEKAEKSLMERGQRYRAKLHDPEWARADVLAWNWQTAVSAVDLFEEGAKLLKRSKPSSLYEALFLDLDPVDKLLLFYGNLLQKPVTEQVEQQIQALFKAAKVDAQVSLENETLQVTSSDTEKTLKQLEFFIRGQYTTEDDQVIAIVQYSALEPPVLIEFVHT